LTAVEPLALFVTTRLPSVLYIEVTGATFAVQVVLPFASVVMLPQGQTEGVPKSARPKVTFVGVIKVSDSSPGTTLMVTLLVIASGDPSSKMLLKLAF
jgi:hypothetical protein